MLAMTWGGNAWMRACDSADADVAAANTYGNTSAVRVGVPAEWPREGSRKHLQRVVCVHEGCCDTSCIT